MDARHSPDAPPPAETLACVQMTINDESPTLLHMPAAAWPYETFTAYIRARMAAMGIDGWPELSQRTGINQSQFSLWRRGRSQPSRDNLKRLAPALGVTPAALYYQAGQDTEEDLGLPAQPDLTVYPQEFRDLLSLYDQVGEGDREFLRRNVRMLVQGLWAQSADQGRPGGRRRVG